METTVMSRSCALPPFLRDRRVVLKAEAEGEGLLRITIGSLPDDVLVEIFNWCRLHSEYDWNYQRRWHNLLQVCRRWRHVMLGYPSHLGLGFLCNLANPITAIPSHLTSIPLVLSFNSDRHRTVSPHSNQELLLALQHRDRVRNISITHGHLGGLELHGALNHAFPMLETLSLSDKGRMALVLPDDFVAPQLRALHLQQVAISKGSSLLTRATNLLSLRLEAIPASDFFLPERLVETLASMLHLEDLSLKFSPSLSLPKAVKELPQPQTTCVLPRLSRLIFTGISSYLNIMLSRISTPFLQDFRFTSLTDETLSVLCLSTFLDRIQDLNPRAAVLLVDPHSVVIAYHAGRTSKSSTFTPPYLRISINNTGNEDLGIICITQICSAIAPALSSVIESLRIQTGSMEPSSFHYNPRFHVEPMHWYAFLRLFRDVKRLGIDDNLAEEIPNILHPSDDAEIEGLLPLLSVLAVTSSQMMWNSVLVRCSPVIHRRSLLGRPIDLQQAQALSGRYAPALYPPRISWPFDTFD